MSKIGNIVFAAGTVAIALVTGYLMQSGASDRPAPTQVASLHGTANDGDHSAMPAAPKPVKSGTNAAVFPVIDNLSGGAGQDMPSEPSPGALLLASLDANKAVTEDILAKPDFLTSAQPPLAQTGSFDDPVAISDARPVTTSPPAAQCEATMTADPTAAAMVQLKVDAPCNRSERLTVHHNGMMFTDMTDAEGRLALQVPALSENALFMVSFATGHTLVAKTEVTSLGFYDRAVVQWRGDISLQIHAREFGAQYGDEGHVWAEKAGSIEQAVTGERGFISHFGGADQPEALFAEVYTFPSGTSKHAGDVLISVEAEVADSNCGREIEAQSIQFSADADLRVQDLVLQMPACDEFGGYLVLKNLLEDLTIALR